MNRQQEAPGPLKRVDRALHAIDQRWLRRRLFLLRATDWSTANRIRSMSRRPILIGGCGRSGTTVLQGLLSCHPEVHAVDIETSAFCPTAYTESVNVNAPFDLARVYRRLIRAEFAPTSTRWSEKTPKNVQFAGRALDYLGPGARFICIVRDGRDVVTSRHRSAPERYWVEPERWIADVEAGRAIENHPRVHTLRYEDLVRSLEETLRELCRFLEMPFDDRMLGYPATAEVPNVPSWQPRLRPISEASVGRWNEPRHEHAVSGLLAHSRATELLHYYGYLGEA